jgi:hypothetical protein
MNRALQAWPDMLQENGGQQSQAWRKQKKFKANHSYGSVLGGKAPDFREAQP